MSKGYSPSDLGRWLVALMIAAGVLGGIWHFSMDPADNQESTAGRRNEGALQFEGWDIAGSPQPVDVSTLPRDRAPPLGAFDDVNVQAAYDAQAKPGDFVTPPAVSQPH